MFAQAKVVKMVGVNLTAIAGILLTAVKFQLKANCLQDSPLLPEVLSWAGSDWLGDIVK